MAKGMVGIESAGDTSGAPTFARSFALTNMNFSAAVASTAWSVEPPARKWVGYHQITL